MITNFGYGQPDRLILDAYPAVAFAGGMRKLRFGYTGPAIRIRRSSDNAELDINYLATHEIDAAAITTFIGGGNAFLHTLYDQGPTANHATQTNAALQLRVYTNKINGHVAFGNDSAPIIGSRLELTNPISTSTAMHTFFAGGNTSYAGEGTMYFHGHSVSLTNYVWLYRFGLDWMQTDSAPLRSNLTPAIRYSAVTEVFDTALGANDLRHMENDVQIGSYSYGMTKDIDIILNGRGTPGDGAMQYFVGSELIIFANVSVSLTAVSTLNQNIMSHYGF